MGHLNLRILQFCKWKNPKIGKFCHKQVKNGLFGRKTDLQKNMIWVGVKSCV